jgi:hypothetical protein
MKKSNAGLRIEELQKELQILENRKAAANTAKENAIRVANEKIAECDDLAAKMRSELLELKKAPKRELETIRGFYETKEKITVTFGGWDGKSYDGEGRALRVWTHSAHPDTQFVLAGRGKYRSFHAVQDTKHPKSGLPEVSYHTDVNDYI